MSAVAAAALRPISHLFDRRPQSAGETSLFASYLIIETDDVT